MDHVSLTPYNVLLSYPNMSDLNYVELLDENGSHVYKSELTEAILTPEENKTVLSLCSMHILHLEISR